MKAFLGVFSVILLISALFVYPMYFRNLRLLIGVIEKQYPNQWQRLGKPKLDSSLSVSNSLSIVGYVLSGSYKKSENPDVIKYGCRSKVLLILGLVIFISFVAMGWLGGNIS